MLKNKLPIRSLMLGLVVAATGPLSVAQPPAVNGLPNAVAPNAAATAPVQQPLNADFIRTNQVLGVPSSFCGHVIDLMMRNQMLRQHGLVGQQQPIHLPHLSVGMTPGDLQISGVQLVSDGDDCNGPVFEVCLHNCSQVPIGNFSVTVVGVLGQICAASPAADLYIPLMEAGQQMNVQIQLPFTCLAMGPQQLPFDTIIVAADSHDQLLEYDELNNVLITRRCDLVAVATEVPVAGQPAAPDAAAPVAPNAAPVTPQTPVAPVAPNEAEQPASPLDDIDVDQLQLGAAQAAIQQF